MIRKKICSSPVLVLAAALVMSPAMAHANSIDSPVIINAAVSCGNGYVCLPINSLSFGFSLSAAAHDVLHFTNMSGKNWTNLTLTEVGVAAADITCTSNIFSCSVVADGSNGAHIVLTAFGSLIGVPAGQSFELGFGCRGGGCTAWPANLSFSGLADPVPEPSTALLLFTGLGILGSATVLGRNRVRWNTAHS